MTTNREHLRLMVLLILCIVLLPSIPIPGLFQIRPEEIIVLILTPWILTHLRWRWSRIDLCFGLIGISTVISMIWGISQGMAFNPRDLMELVKLIKYWLMFRLASYNWTEQDIRKIIFWIMVSMSLAALIGITQWNNWAGLGELTRNLYGQTMGHAEKYAIIGTTANPNDFAMLLASGMALIGGAVFWRQHKLIIIVAVCVQLLAIVFTGSRSGLMASIGCLALIFAVNIFNLRRISIQRWPKWMVLLLTILALIIIPCSIFFGREIQVVQDLKTNQEKIEYVRQGQIYRIIYKFSNMVSLKPEDAGIGTRVLIWQDHWNTFIQSPLLGWGPGKSSQSVIVDSEYLLYLRRYGILGMAFYLLLFWQVLRAGRRLMRCFPDRSVAWSFGLSLQVITLSYLVLNFVLSTYYNLQLMSLFWLLVGVAYSTLRNYYHSSPEASPLTCIS